MSETTSTPSTGWIRVPLFLLLLIVQPVGTSHWGPVASPQQQQEPNDRETFHVPQNQLSSSHKWDHLTDNMDGIEKYGRLVCIRYKM